MRPALVVCVVFCLLAVAGAARADVPDVMSYQGVLRDDLGNVVPDDDYLLTFRIYNVVTGGTPLWSEDQSVTVSDGIFDVTLGVVTPLGLDFDVQYWLAIAVEHGSELVPRTQLTTAPYAFRADVAESLDGPAVPDDDWMFNGDHIYRMDGSVGIGTSSPSRKLHIREDVNYATGITIENRDPGPTSSQFIHFNTEEGSAGISLYDDESTFFPSGLSIANNQYYGGIQFRTGGVMRLMITGNGKVGVGESDPAEKLDVAGTVQMNGFQLMDSPAIGRVLTSDATGVGSWQAPAAVPDGDWGIAVDDLYAMPDGNVGIGNDIPDAKLDIAIAPASTVEALRVQHAGSPTRLVNLERMAAPSSANDILQIKTASDAPDDAQFIECERGLTPVFQVMTDGSIFADGGGTFDDAVDITGPLAVDHYGLRAGDFRSGYLSNSVHVVHAEVTATGMADPIAVFGTSTPNDNYGIGAYFEGGYRGVVGTVAQTGAGSIRGVYGTAGGGNGSNYALYGSATGGWTSYGIYASASGGASASYAGYFVGNTHVSGTLSKSAGSFKIDHPLDPANKYLSHSFVESPDMMNVYNGNVVMDGAGEAWVELPEWFDVLNRDFRYQLTALDAPGPNLHVAERIAGNRFMIAGGDPGMEVSWQVTGMRQDEYARAHPVVVEEAKPAHEAGKYLHPDLYGLPETAAVGYEEEREIVIEQSERAPAPERVWDPTDGE